MSILVSGSITAKVHAVHSSRGCYTNVFPPGSYVDSQRGTVLVSAECGYPFRQIDKRALTLHENRGAHACGTISNSQRLLNIFRLLSCKVPSDVSAASNLASVVHA